MSEWFAARVRVARPTDQLEKVVAFYRDGLGLSVIGHFEDHAGYDGVMLGMPDANYHLEFTQHVDGSP
ncbi:MAG: VOC family protein, partial [Anaerolineae bacterium]|nr:VOC family protein [Anaerolineae bacterium]